MYREQDKETKGRLPIALESQGQAGGERGGATKRQRISARRSQIRAAHDPLPLPAFNKRTMIAGAIVWRSRPAAPPACTGG
jgi:hypothetical protein